MIKIPLNNEKRQFIEKKYWEIIEKRTKIIKNFETRQDDIKECNPKLEEFLYNNNKFCKERLKSIVLANKEAMLNYIEKFNIKSDSKSFEKNKKLIQSFFDYSRITRRNEFYDILNEINVSVCPYCNRQYTFTVKRNHTKIKPSLDHYYPKSIYPFLALSIWNLIPCCSSCNLAKSNKDTVDNPILYPYEEEFGEKINFDIQCSKESDFVKFIYGLEDSFEVIIDKNNLSLAQRNHIDFLHLIELYNGHKSYIQNIIKKNYINSEDYINTLYKCYPQLFNTIDDVKNLIYATTVEKENWVHYPLSKLTRDILATFDEEKN